MGNTISRVTTKLGLSACCTDDCPSILFTLPLLRYSKKSGSITPIHIQKIYLHFFVSFKFSLVSAWSKFLLTLMSPEQPSSNTVTGHASSIPRHAVKQLSGRKTYSPHQTDEMAWLADGCNAIWKTVHFLRRLSRPTSAAANEIQRTEPNQTKGQPNSETVSRTRRSKGKYKQPCSK